MQDVILMVCGTTANLTDKHLDEVGRDNICFGQCAGCETGIVWELKGSEENPLARRVCILCAAAVMSFAETTSTAKPTQAMKDRLGVAGAQKAVDQCLDVLSGLGRRIAETDGQTGSKPV